MISMLAWPSRFSAAGPGFLQWRIGKSRLYAHKIVLLPFPADCIYPCEVREMHLNQRVQEIWLRLLGAGDSSRTPRIERVEEGYYAVARDACKRAKCPVSAEREDLRAVKPFIPHLVRTRAVYLNKASAFGLGKAESLVVWAGQLGEQVVQGTRHAFAIVEADVFANEVAAFLRASGWIVEHVDDALRVSDGRFAENANLLRAIVQMVLFRTTFADAARSLKTQLAGRFLLDAQLFARFEERFAQYRPAVIDRYFTVCPDCSHLAAGWDYCQISNCDNPGAMEIFEQAMKEFETLLATPQEDWLPAVATVCCERSILNLEVTHD
jgi:hypothetical protein